jgi:hypothetical protein
VNLRQLEFAKQILENTEQYRQRTLDDFKWSPFESLAAEKSMYSESMIQIGGKTNYQETKTEQSLNLTQNREIFNL